jgi:myosin protein heavy chain
MLPSQLTGSTKRANPFGRASPSPSPSSSPQAKTRPKSAVIASAGKFEETKGHFRHSSTASHSSITPFARNATHQRSNSLRNDVASGTFAPEFIKSEDLRRGADQIRGQEGDNDFSGNKYVWLRDPEKAFIKGLVLEENGGRLLVQTDDGQV